MAAASSSDPIAAMPPVSSTNRQTASTLGPMEPGGEVEAPQAGRGRRAGSGAASACRSRASRAATSVSDQQHVGVEGLGEHGAGQVLVDDGLDALQIAALVADDRYSSAAGADDDRAALQEQPDQPGLDDPLRRAASRRRDASRRRPA